MLYRSNIHRSLFNNIITIIWISERTEVPRTSISYTDSIVDCGWFHFLNFELSTDFQNSCSLFANMQTDISLTSLHYICMHVCMQQFQLTESYQFVFEAASDSAIGPFGAKEVTIRFYYLHRFRNLSKSRVSFFDSFRV